MNKPILIDANELKDIIDGSEEFIDWQKKEICECIDCCDTAYDIDNIVRQMEYDVEDLSGLELMSGKFAEGYKWATKRHIEIVRGGDNE